VKKRRNQKKRVPRKINTKIKAFKNLKGMKTNLSVSEKKSPMISMNENPMILRL